MASIRKNISLDAPAERVWAAIRDFGAVHERLAPGFVVKCTMEGDARLVTFAKRKRRPGGARRSQRR